MILAAGKGSRMLPLTNTIPKPLVKLRDKPLIEYQIENLAKAGVTNIVINVMHHKDQIMQALGDGDKYKVKITYSIENVLLGTGGGIVKALPLFNGKKFIVASADIYTDFDFATFNQPINNSVQLAHIVLVANRPFHKKGDFVLKDGIVFNIDSKQTNTSFTYASIGVYHPDFFVNAPKGVFCLGTFLKSNAASGKISGETYTNVWHNIGTIEQIKQLEDSIRP